MEDSNIYLCTIGGEIGLCRSLSYIIICARNSYNVCTIVITHVHTRAVAG